MKLIIKPSVPAVTKQAEVVKATIPPKANPPPLSLPGKTLPVKTKKDLPEDISEEDIERLAAEMEEMNRALKNKNGSGYDLSSTPSRKDLTWTNDFKAWGDKRGFKYEVLEFSDNRMDLYKQESGTVQLRLCIVRAYNHFNLGFYFNIGSVGYPKSVDFSMIRKAKVIDALNYMYNALSLFDEKE